VKPAEAFFAGGGAGNRDPDPKDESSESPDPKDESSESKEELQAVIAEAMCTEYKMTELQDDLIQDDCRRRLAVAARRRAQRHCRRRPQRPSALAVAISSTTPSKTCRPTASAITCAGAHGWQAWKIVKRARADADPGISHDTNVVEHPETWSSTPSWWPRAARQDRRARKHHRQNPSRLCAKAVYRRLRLSIIWAKLQTLAEEARLRARDCGRSLH